MKIYRLISISLFLVLSLSLQAQMRGPKSKAGGSISHNFRTHGFALGARAEYPLSKIDLLEGVSLIPQLTLQPYRSYFDINIGIGGQLGVYNYSRWNFYALGSVFYNLWIDNDEFISSHRDNPRLHNLGFDVGGGVSTYLGKCWQPFFELRTNLIWWEPSFQLGLLYTLKCDRRGAVPCSKPPKEPFDFFKSE